MENIKEIIESHIPSKVELLSFKYNSSTSFIKIVIDSIEHITIDDTAKLAKDIKNDDYVLSHFPDGIRLEVGTPGVGSKLEKAFQYEKNVGRHVELEYYDGSDIIKSTYLLTNVVKNGIVVKENDKKINISLNDIKTAKIKISFD
tara:strand:+ start:817 stop:1251 length:435 start_codon:yes stop_codon:yes gene_type:complete